MPTNRTILFHDFIFPSVPLFKGSILLSTNFMISIFFMILRWYHSSPFPSSILKVPLNFMKLTRTVTLHILGRVHKYALLIFGANLPWLEMVFMLCLIVSGICVCVNAYWFFNKPMGIKTLYKVHITQRNEARNKEQGNMLCSSFFLHWGLCWCFLYNRHLIY